MSNQIDRISKFLSYVLRHKPEAIGITLDVEGWVDTDTLITQANQHGESLNREQLEQVVATNDKKRFTLSSDGLRIRAAQGHSSEQVQITYTELPPPEFLYHGTASRFISAIRQQGLVAGARHYVHLSADEQTAAAVGKRYGKPVVLKIKTQAMLQQGFVFYQADNGVWLTEKVPTEFIL